MTKTRESWRIELIARLPWIERLDAAQVCDQYRWSAMSRKAAHNPELKEKYRCRVSGLWKFTGLEPDDPKDPDWMLVGKSGIYCYAHLVNQAFIPYDEMDRYEEWCRENTTLVKRIKSGVEPRIIKKVRKNAPHDLSDEA